MTEHIHLLKPENPVGIVGYGAYVPRYRLPASEVARVWTDGTGGLPIQEKSVPGTDEDVATMSIEAARNAVARAQIEHSQILGRLTSLAHHIGEETRHSKRRDTLEAVVEKPFVESRDIEDGRVVVKTNALLAAFDGDDTPLLILREPLLALAGKLDCLDARVHRRKPFFPNCLRTRSHETFAFLSEVYSRLTKSEGINISTSHQHCNKQTPW